MSDIRRPTAPRVRRNPIVVAGKLCRDIIADILHADTKSSHGGEHGRHDHHSCGYLDSGPTTLRLLLRMVVQSTSHFASPAQV